MSAPASISHGGSSLRAPAPLSTSRPRAQPAVTSGSRGPACTPTKPRAASGLGRKARQPSGGGVTTEGKPMDSRTRMEKVGEVKFTTATSGGREHATGLRAAATFSASWPRPGRPAPCHRVPGVPPPVSRLRETHARERGLAQQGPAREIARAPALGGRTRACADRTSDSGARFAQYALWPLVFSTFSLSPSCRSRLTCKFLSSNSFSLPTKGYQPIPDL